MAMDNFESFLEIEKELYKCISKAHKDKKFKRKTENEEKKEEEKKEDKKEDDKKEDKKEENQDNKEDKEDIGKEKKDENIEKKEENKKESEEKEETYLIPIEEDAFDDLNEWLVLYHGVRPKKVYKKDKNTKEKNYYLKFTQSQLLAFHYQKYRLSLIALLLKNNLFITEKKYIVYHPFKYSIEIRNYKTNKEYDEVDKSLMNLNRLSPGDYYLYEYKKYYFYLHFFNKELGKEIFSIIQKIHYEFNEVFETKYNNDKDPTDAQLYKYMRDESYLNYLLNGFDKKYVNEKRNLSKYKNKEVNSDDSDIDEDGFTVVKKKNASALRIMDLINPQFGGTTYALNP